MKCSAQLSRVIIAVGVTLVMGTGCAVITPGPSRRSAAMTGGTPECHPSQYWDGTTCRHKGQGHGARKHDGR